MDLFIPVTWHIKLLEGQFIKVKWTRDHSGPPLAMPLATFVLLISCIYTYLSGNFQKFFFNDFSGIFKNVFPDN